MLKLPVIEFSQLLKSNGLKCRSEDHVLALTIAYIERVAEKIINEAKKTLLPLIRIDQLSKARLIELS